MSSFQKTKTFLLNSLIYLILYIIKQILILKSSISETYFSIKSRINYTLNTKVLLYNQKDIINEGLFNKKLPLHIGMIIKKNNLQSLFNIIRLCEYAHILKITIYDVFSLYNHEDIEKYIRNSNIKIEIQYFNTKNANSELIKSFLLESLKKNQKKEAFFKGVKNEKLTKESGIERFYTKKNDDNLPGFVLNFHEDDEIRFFFNSVNLLGFPFLLMENCEIM